VSSIGLNAFRLRIHSVRLNGTDAAFQVVPYNWDSLPQGLLDATGSVLDAAYATLSEDVETEYRRFLDQEQQPELVIQVRSILELSAVHPLHMHSVCRSSIRRLAASWDQPL
jgi:hypothetical protein